MSKKRKIFIFILTFIFAWCLIGTFLNERSAVPFVIAIYALILFFTGKGPAFKKAAVVFMVFPVLISFMDFVQVKEWWIFRWNKNYSIAPSFISTLAGILLDLSVVIRGRLKIFSTPHEVVLFILNILFCASFLEIFVSKDVWKIPFINVSSQSFLIAAIIFSWIGMRAFAGFIWIGLFLISLSRIVGLNVAMGNLGVIYILSAAVGLLLQGKDHIHLLSSFKDDFIGSASRITDDVNASISVTKKAVSMAATAATGVPVSLPDDNVKSIENKTK